MELYYSMSYQKKEKGMRKSTTFNLRFRFYSPFCLRYLIASLFTALYCLCMKKDNQKVEGEIFRNQNVY